MAVHGTVGAGICCKPTHANSNHIRSIVQKCLPEISQTESITLGVVLQSFRSKYWQQLQMGILCIRPMRMLIFDSYHGSSCIGSCTWVPSELRNHWLDIAKYIVRLTWAVSSLHWWNNKLYIHLSNPTKIGNWWGKLKTGKLTRFWLMTSTSKEQFLNLYIHQPTSIPRGGCPKRVICI